MIDDINKMKKEIEINEIHTLHGVDRDKVQLMLDKEDYYCPFIPVIEDLNGHYYLADQHHRMCAWLLHKAGYNKVPDENSIISVNFSNYRYDENSTTITADVAKSSLDFDKISKEIRDKNNTASTIAATLDFGAIKFFTYKNAIALNADKAFLTELLKERGELFGVKRAIHNNNEGTTKDVIEIVKLAKAQGIKRVLIEFEVGYNFTNPDEGFLIENGNIYRLYDIESSLNNPDWYYFVDKFSDEALEQLLGEYYFSRFSIDGDLLTFDLA